MKDCSVETHERRSVSQVELLIRNREGISVCSCLCTVFDNGKAKVMWVDSVGTMEEHRHQGYATLLMEEVVKLAQDLNIDSVELVASADDETVKRLYGRAGLRPTEKQHRQRILNRWPTT